MSKIQLHRTFLGSLIFLFISLGTITWTYAQSKDQALASVYQYEVSVGSKSAYLWIPPKCKQLKGLIISFANLLERNWMEDPIIRKVAAKNNLGVLLIEISADGITPQLNPENKLAFLKMLKDLANKSGYTEVESIPFIPIEHSIHSVFCWNLATWLPQRTIAAIPVKGLPFPADENIAGIPMCYIIGENDEWPAVKDGKPWSRNYVWPQIRNSATTLRAANEDNLIGVVTDAGGGHLDWSDELSKIMALFITKACQYRLSNKTAFDEYPKLKAVDRQRSWLTDTAGLDRDKFPPTAYQRYKGNKAAAYWFFNKEMAEAAMQFAGDRKKRKKQMVTFIQQDTAVQLQGKPFVSLAFNPDSNGTTFRSKGTFFEIVPSDFVQGGQPLGHAVGEVTLRIICGPAKQIGPNTFELAFNRSALGGDVWLQATHPGNVEFSKAVQPAQIKLPVGLTKGTLQSIAFPRIPNQSAKKLTSIKLKATSSSGLPVQYFIKSGPAIIEGDTLIFTSIPPKSKYPVKITVVAWQWGRSSSPQIQSAKMVTQTFEVLK